MTERSVNVKLRMQVAEYLAGARAASAATRDVDKAARDLRKSLDDEEAAAGRVRVAEQKLTEVRADGKAKASQLAAAEEGLARAHRQHEVAVTRVTEANKRFVQSQKDAAAETKKTADKVDTDMSRVAQRTNQKFDALKFTGLSVGLPAAAAVGVLATTGIVAAAGALFIGLGVAGAMGAEKVSLSWIDTGNTVTQGITKMSGIYESKLVTASGQVEDAFLRSTGLIQRGMVNASGGVEILTGGVLNLAENALPGVVTASSRLQPILVGTSSLLSDVGLGFGEMAANASQGSVGASKDLVILGDTLRTTEARVGTLSANLANASSGPLNSFRFILDQATGALVDMTSQGSATLGFLGGFTTTTSGAVTVARGLLTIVNSLPPGIAQLGGSLTTTAMIMGKFGVDGGKGFEGFTARIKEAEGAGGKFKATMSGLVSGIFNPAAIAVGALSIGLWGLGAAEEKASAKAAEYRENVRSLTDAIRQDKGEVSEATAVANLHALAQKNTADNVKSANISLAQATVASNGNADAMRAVNDQSNKWIQTVAQKAGVGQKDIDVAKTMNQLLLKQGGAYSDLNPLLSASGKSQVEVTEANAAMSRVLGKLGPQQANQLVALLNGTGAIGEQARATRDAYTAYVLQEQGLTDLTEAQIKARDATIEHTKAIYDQQNANLGYRGSVQSTKEALDAYNKIAKEGKLSTDAGVRATLALENAMSAQEQAAYKAAYANSTAKTEQERVKEATVALNRETINLANGFKGPLPVSLQQTISKMSVTEAQAAGLKVGVDNLGRAVYTLPNGKNIVLAANSQQAQDAIYQVSRALADLHNKTVYVDIIQRGKSSLGISPTGAPVFSAAGNLFMAGDGAAHPAAFFADGGLPGSRMSGSSATVVPPNTLRYVGDNMHVPELFAPLNGSARSRELIISAAEHEGIFGPRMAMASGGLVQAEDGTWVPESFYGGAPNGPHAMYTESGFAKLRAQAMSSGIGSLSAMDQNQLRTYGGWIDTVVQAIQSGNAVQQTPSFASSYGGGSAGRSGAFTGSLYLDNGTFMGVVRGEIRKDKRATRRSVTTGSGGNR